MSFNLERAIAIGTDILGLYVLPKLALNQASKVLALKDLDKAITEKCGEAGAENRADLAKNLEDALRQKRFEWFGLRFPAQQPKVPENFSKALAGKPLLPQFLSNKPFPIGFPLINIAINWASAWAFTSHIPWIKTLGFVQTGEYNTALNQVLGTSQNVDTKANEYNNVVCKKGPPPSAGTTEKASEASTAVDSSADTAAARMSVSASMAAPSIPASELLDKLDEKYGVETASTGAGKTTDTLPSLQNPGLTPTVKAGSVPIFSTGPMALPQVAPVLAPRPVLVVR